MAPVTLPASEQETRTALAPSLTACAMRCACTWPSSPGGVSHTISTGTPVDAVSSFAAASAPVRADRKTGLAELFAIIAIFSPGGFAVEPPAGWDPPHAERAVSASTKIQIVGRRV